MGYSEEQHSYVVMHDSAMINLGDHVHDRDNLFAFKMDGYRLHCNAGMAKYLFLSFSPEAMESRM